MSFASVLAALTALGTILGSMAYFFNWFTWETKKTQAQTDQEIDSEVASNKEQAENSGRPQ